MDAKLELASSLRPILYVAPSAMSRSGLDLSVGMYTGARCATGHSRERREAAFVFSFWEFPRPTAASPGRFFATAGFTVLMIVSSEARQLEPNLCKLLRAFCVSCLFVYPGRR